MWRNNIVRIALISALVLSAVSSSAAPIPSAIFSDHMVLQRDKPVVIWGRADPGEHIRASIHGETSGTVTDAEGRWKLSLPAMKAGGPYTLIVEGKKTVVLRDIMVGEVWLFSGQSNMSFPVSRAGNAQAALASADHPQIRLFTVPKTSSLEPVSELNASWEICTPASARDFSAVAYFFGVQLAEKLGIPIGLIHSSWPGTTAEEWIEHQVLTEDRDFAPILERWQQESAEVRDAARAGFPFDLNFADFELIRESGSTPASAPFSQFDKKGWINTLGGFWTYSWDTAAHSRFELTGVSSGQSGVAARLAGRLPTSEDAVLKTSFAPDNRPVDLSSYTALQFRSRGKGYFQLQSLQPTVTDAAEYSSQIFRATDEWQTITIPFRKLRQPDWGVQTPFTQSALLGLQIVVLNSQEEYPARPPSALYNGMIAPLALFPIRGFVWYQGESNALRAYQYRKLLPALIRNWRTEWNSQDMPFLIVQLPNHGRRNSEPAESAWAELREAELMTSRMPNVGLAVTIDLGEAGNVHPSDKVDVGTRLALLAEGMVYREPLSYSGPIFEFAQIVGNTIRIHFRNIFNGLRSKDDRPLSGFSIAADDRRFVWATAKIEGDEVVVSSPALQSPKAVRYEWADNPEGNLTNDSGIPASPFRTDSWPGITEGKN